MGVKGEGGGWAGRHEGEEQVGGRWGTGREKLKLFLPQPHTHAHTHRSLHG